MTDFDSWNTEDLRKLKHNDHQAAFMSYENNTLFVRYKQPFLYAWVKPQPHDYILECRSSSRKTCVDSARRSHCRMLGIDFDEGAITISTELQQKYFPELNDTCCFQKNNLSTMEFDKHITKVIMPDFTEHIPDRVFQKILKNIQNQLSHVTLYIYA